MVKLEQFEWDFEQALAYIEKYDGIEKTRQVAIDKTKRAIDLLDCFDESIYKSFLINIATFIRDRVIFWV